MKPRVSVVVTAKDENETIMGALARIAEAVEVPCEVLVVCDSLEDTTVPWVKKYAEEDDRVRLVINAYGPGPARAIRSGFDAAVADVVVVTMADGCDDPQQIDQLT
ncbi:MAG TPA: glycosyltransferase, partial [Acidimicrobiales bacterium]|nr:glycosyltransferase [Acidimicrobiales bacterium]